ncbi:venom protease [Halyomorpha halys]|uniref:venom protease n=1 Tax=Halyomorpha halys TaxID=286706 RepID=UPI0006D4DDA2|nr:venom protease [Halyomorpha halys]
MVLILSLVTFIAIHCITAESYSSIADQDCRTPNGTSGICIDIRSCQPLLPLLKKVYYDEEAVAFLRRSKCGIGIADVCCTPNPKPPNQSNLHVEGCGISNSQPSRIVGGVEAELGAWPWIAVLGYYRRSSIKWDCGGSLINHRYILTAAHCVSPVPPAKVKLGEHNLHREDDEAVEFNIEKTIIHPQYSILNYANDIALIRLQRDVDFSDTVKPVCLPQTDALRSSKFEGKYPYVIGWGHTTNNGPKSDVLQQVQVPVVENENCTKAYKKMQYSITGNQICAGKEGKDSCQADSGGPLLLPDAERYYQIGIVSTGYKCGEPDYPGVYTRITSYLDWINNNIE